MKNQARERVLTELDHVRLATMSGRAPSARRASSIGIDEVLDDALVVPSRRVGADVVTMHSQVLLRFDDGGQRKLTLCYPETAAPGLGVVSVLSPIGLALLGQRAGARVRWASPDGRERIAEVAAILFQPEASGDYTS